MLLRLLEQVEMNANGADDPFFGGLASPGSQNADDSPFGIGELKSSEGADAGGKSRGNHPEQIPVQQAAHWSRDFAAFKPPFHRAWVNVKSQGNGSLPASFGAHFRQFFSDSWFVSHGRTFTKKSRHATFFFANVAWRDISSLVTRHSKSPMQANETATESKTRVVFDLRDELTAEEIAAFEASAAAAGAATLTEHFLNITLRLAPGQRPAA
jgi:hypothetical protein